MTPTVDNASLNHPALKVFQANPVIPVIRAYSSEDALWGAHQLIEHGFRILEITWTVPKAHQVIQTLRAQYPYVSIGAGTMLTTNQMNVAINAGAQWLVSPVVDTQLIQHAQSKHIELIPGALTPSELFQAFNQGVGAIKVFPIGPMGGVSYLKSLLEPLRALGPMQLIPTGGVQLDDISDYLSNDALAVGLGSQLASPHILKARDEKALAEHAKTALFYQARAKSNAAAL